ncbi:hypothetical protein AJ79_04531 [Helicocarpus griseus UAMH5409]|uniref:Uncharacterized protein n=1 Tax=Helicocarpus griseus UAMH5409 TaxID=1447875 RepID=A0A2B7XTQ7_9EURO|nr:hypothetical protein AJ79_04531 [Helicocarpus griseus UAMH5409]
MLSESAISRISEPPRFTPLSSPSPPAMESNPLILQQSPGAPLHPVSPERINQQKMNGSPVHPSELSPLRHKHARGNSEVQAKVAFLNGLSRGNSPAHSHPSSTTTAALQRAILGREEAEASLQATMDELAEANSRERRVSERLESLMEELHSLKERQAHERAVFEKEVRRARKEAFRAGSALVKAQEELKSSRGEIKSLREEVTCERDAKEKAKQEAFERAYALAGLTEELEVLREKARSAETDNHSDALQARAEEMRAETPKPRSPLMERNITEYTPTPRRLKPDQAVVPRQSTGRRSAINSQIASPRWGSPLKMNVSRRNSCKENEDPQQPNIDADLVEDLKENLEWEKRLRFKAEDMVHFLKMECQFRRCSCRIAEMQGAKYIHDTKWDKTNPVKEENAYLFSHRPTTFQETHPSNPSPVPQPPPADASSEMVRVESQPAEPVVAYCPDTGTFKAISPCAVKTEPPIRQQTISREPSPLPHESHFHQAPASLPAAPPSPEVEIEDPKPPELQAEPPVQGYRHSHTIAHPPPAALEPASSSRSFPRNLHIETAHFPAREQHADATIPTTTDPLRTTSTTTTVPIHSENYISNSNCPIPGTPITREEALAQIRARRGRAQTLKRSASANDAASQRSRSRPRLTNASSMTPMQGSRRVPATSSRPTSRVAKRDFSAPVGRY